MKVYILVENFGGREIIHGVFKTKEKAMSKISELVKYYNGNVGNFEIEEEDLIE